MKYLTEMGSAAHDTHTKFHKDWFRHSKNTQNGGRISLISFFFRNKESRLNIEWQAGSYIGND
jgi:hypothetical protein